MNNKEFARKAIEISRLKTLYVKGGFGAPASAKNKARYSNSYEYNKQRAGKINACSSDTFFFDCCGLAKSILWGFSANPNAVYGGAEYGSNGVPDISEERFRIISNPTTKWKDVPVGAGLYMKGHMGIYIGDGLAVEATPKWKDGVQITAVGNLGKKDGYNTRTWESWGKIPFIFYEKEDNEVITDIKVKNAKTGEIVTLKGIHKDQQNYIALADLAEHGFAVVGWDGEHPVLAPIHKCCCAKVDE